MYLRDQEVDIAERRDQRKRDRKSKKVQAKQERVQRQQEWAAEHKRQREAAAAEKEERMRYAAFESKKKKQAEHRQAMAEKRKEARKHLQPGYNANSGSSFMRGRDDGETSLRTSDKVAVKSRPAPRKKSGNVAETFVAEEAPVALIQQPLTSEKYVPPALRRAKRGVEEAVRSACNKLTPNNIPVLTEEVTDLFLGGKHARADVLSALAESIISNALLQDTPVTEGVSLAYAGLVRGLQILHGNDVGAPIIERICLEVHQQRQLEAESSLRNGSVLLASLFVNYCVDCDLAVSFLHSLLSETATEADSVAAVSFVQVAGEKLRKEAPLGLNQAIVMADKASKSAAGVSQRKSMLLSSIKMIAAALRPKPKKGGKNMAVGLDGGQPMPAQDAAVAVSKGVCSLIAKRLGESSNNTRALERAVSSTNVLNVKWNYIIREDKPSRWYAIRLPEVPVAKRSREEKEAEEEEDNRGDDEDEEGYEEERQARAQRVRREEIAAMRAEETALAGQRFPTEAKRQIFKCITNATDDIEAFQSLMMRDPSGTQLLDTAAVLLQCCQQEALFNPFYGRVLQRLVSSKKPFRQTLQFAIWDRFKIIRLDPVDVTSYINLASIITQLIEEGIYSLALFRGLDMDSVNKQAGFFCKVLMTRLVAALSAKALTMTFFGTDGLVAADLNTDTNKIRKCVAQFLERYFLDQEECAKWLPHLYDVVCCGTVFANGHDPEGFMKRVTVAHKALKGGVS